MTESERRTEIMAAVERLLGRGGGDAVTMRAVAAEAGVSLRLVQYYGRSKGELLDAVLDDLADKSVARWRARTRRRGTPGSAIDAVEEFFVEALPTDRVSREFHRIGVSLEAVAVSSPEAAGRAYRRHLAGLADHLSGVLRDDGAGSADAHRLALEVMALAHGVGTLLMADQLTEPDAWTLVRDYLERLAPRLHR